MLTTKTHKTLFTSCLQKPLTCCHSKPFLTWKPMLIFVSLKDFPVETQSTPDSS